jgi:hypothetical protein
MGFQTETQSSARRARSPRRAAPGEGAGAGARAARAASAARARAAVAPNPFPAEPPRAARRAPRPLACPAPAAHDQPLRRAELVEAATPLSRASHEQLDSDISHVQEELAALGEVQRELAKSGRLSHSHSLPELALSLARGSRSMDLGAPLSSRSSTRSAMLAEWSLHEGSEEERANADFIARQQRRLRAASCPEARQSGSDDIVARVLAVRTPRLATALAFWAPAVAVPDAAAPGISPTAAIATTVAVAAAAAAAAAASFRSRGARPSPLDTSAFAFTSGKTTAAARPPSAGKPPLAPTPVNDENRAGNRACSSPRLRGPESAHSCGPTQCASPSIRIYACRVRVRLRCPLR